MYTRACHPYSHLPLASVPSSIPLCFFMLHIISAVRPRHCIYSEAGAPVLDADAFFACHAASTRSR